MIYAIWWTTSCLQGSHCPLATVTSHCGSAVYVSARSDTWRAALCLLSARSEL